MLNEWVGVKGVPCSLGTLDPFWVRAGLIHSVKLLTLRREGTGESELERAAVVAVLEAVVVERSGEVEPQHVCVAITERVIPRAFRWESGFFRFCGVTINSIITSKTWSLHLPYKVGRNLSLLPRICKQTPLRSMKIVEWVQGAWENARVFETE